MWNVCLHKRKALLFVPPSPPYVQEPSTRSIENYTQGEREREKDNQKSRKKGSTDHCTLSPMIVSPDERQNE